MKPYNGRIDWKIVITGLVCITILEGIALLKGIDGLYLTIVIGVIAAAIGINIPRNKIIK